MGIFFLWVPPFEVLSKEGDLLKAILYNNDSLPDVVQKVLTDIFSPQTLNDSSNKV